MLVCVSYKCTLHTRPRVQRAPGLPRALFFSEGVWSSKAKLGRSASRDSEGIFGRHRPPTGRANARPMTGSGGRSSIPEAAMIEPKGRSVLDTRFRGYDGFVLGKTAKQ